MLRKELDQAQGLTAQELLPQLPSCIPPASLHLLQEGTQEGGPGQGEGEQDRCPRLPPAPTFSLQSSGHADGRTCLHHCSAACPSGLIPEEGVA